MTMDICCVHTSPPFNTLTVSGSANCLTPVFKEAKTTHLRMSLLLAA